MILFCSCNKKSDLKIEGELYFKLINYFPSQGMTSSQIISIENMLDTIKETKEIIAYKEQFSILKKNNLLKQPYLLIRSNNDSIKTIYLSKTEYNKVKNYTLQNLLNNKSKVLLKIDARNIESNIYYSDKIYSVKEISGITQFKK